MCLLNKTPEYIILFLLLLSKNIFGTYGSSGPPTPRSLFSANDNYHSIATTTTTAAATTTTLTPPTILSTTTAQILSIEAASLTNNTTMKPEKTWSDISLNVLKATIMISIIVASVFGNLLVIISVMRNRKLRWVSSLTRSFRVIAPFFSSKISNSILILISLCLRYIFFVSVICVRTPN